MPGMLKTVSVRIAPPSRMPMSRPSTVTTGVIALRTPWRRITRALREALGARGADVVLAQHVEQRAAQQARVDRGERRSASTNHGRISDWNHSHAGRSENGT